jgi:hypothetical protein
MIARSDYKANDEILAELFRDCDGCRELMDQFPTSNGNCSKELQAWAEQVWLDKLAEHLRWCHT